MKMRTLINLCEAQVEDDFDDEDQDRGIFSAGYCHALALSLHESTGLPMVALFAREGRRWAIIHVMVESAEGEYLDIDGVRSIDDILYDADIDSNETACELRECDEADLRKWVQKGLVAISPEIKQTADAAAKRVLMRVNWG